MDILSLKGMRFHARHGYYDKEKETGNVFEVDLEFFINAGPAAENDDLELTIDYSKARAIVAEVMNGASLNLIETLCCRIGEKLFNSLNPDKLNVFVRKLNPPMQEQTKYSEIFMQWPR